LLPADQDAGALAALKAGAITPEQFQAFLDAPEKLMAGNAGNALTDRLAHLAETGKLKRDPDWSPPTKATAPLAAREAELLARLDEIDPVRMSLGDDMTPVRDSEARIDMAPEVLKEAQAIRAELQALKATTIRNPLSYRATAEANQARVSQSLASVQGNADLGESDREILASAVTALGSTSSKAKAQELATDAIDRLPEGLRAYGRSVLSPLVAQVKK
ncbi:MAG: hypothetical protein ACOY3S_03515, partial [Pseudomonadota bacterium]